MAYTLSEYVHDVDRTIGEIAKLSAIKDNQKNDLSLLVANHRAINSISLVLSAKTSYLNYCDAAEKIESGLLDPSEVDFHRSVFSFCRSVERISYSAQRLNSIHHKTNSSSSIKLNIKESKDIIGPDFFEFIPFAILDNAVKYNINDRQILVEIDVIADKCVAEISSYGPKILPSEEDSIFEKEFRGKNAIRTGRDGEGIGLFHARNAVREYFNGDITLFRKPNVVEFGLNGVDFAYQTFRLVIPSYTSESATR